MNIKLPPPTVNTLRPRITVVGVGGAGSNAVNNMIAAGLSGVNFVVANTDAQSLANSTAEHRIQLGASLTEGLGAGARPEIGKAAAEEAMEEIRARVSGSHMVFVAGGMGGGTGTGAAAVIARIARECGALTVGVVTKPFQFEGTRRMRAAEIGIAALKPEVDTLIVIPNQNLFRIATERTSFADAFVLADQVLYSGIACVVDLIIKDGLINLDFADVRTVMSGMGTAMMGTGEAAGQGRAVAAAEEAITNPLLDDISLNGARGLLVSITGSRDMTLYEVDEAANRVRQEVDAEATIIVGATFDDALGDRIRVSIVASGMERMSPQDTNAGWPSAPVQFVAEQHAPQQFDVQPVPVSLPGHGYGHGPQASQDQAGAHQALSGLGARHVPEQPDLTRLLSEALDHRPPEAPPHYQHPHQQHSVQHQQPAQQAWASQSGAVFAEAPPQLAPTLPSAERGHFANAYADAAIAHGAASGHGGAETGFTPQPPADSGQRRLPQVEDFPLVGQRDYHAKVGQYVEPAQSHQPQPLPPPPRAYSHPAPVAEPPRKLGFFERLTGARRKAAQPSPAPQPAPIAEQPSRPQAPASSQGWPDGHRLGPAGPSQSASSDGSGRTPSGNREAHELPAFFGGNRK